MSYYTFWERLNEENKHLGIGGIQGWSAGQIFPYSIRVVRNHGDGSGTGGVIQAISPDGRVVHERDFEKMGPGGDFQQVHQEVEDYVLQNILGK
jgi:hypothetical protein